jgi:hypothetical protein
LQPFVLRVESLAQLREVAGYLPAACVGAQKRAQLLALSCKQRGDAAHVADARVPQSCLHQRGGDAQAVQDVADTVQNPGGDFRHARIARGIAQLLLQFAPALFLQDLLGHIP